MNLKNLITFFFVAVTLQVHAKNLDQYRIQIGGQKSLKKSNDDVQTMVAALRQKLGTSSTSISSTILNYNLKEISTRNRVSYNTYVKNILQGSLDRLSQEEKYQSPVAIDDTFSIEKLVYAKENIKRANCIQGFLGEGDKKKSIDSFLQEFLGLVRDSKKTESAIKSSGVMSAYVKLLQAEIAKFGFVEQKLGTVSGVLVTDNVVKEILLNVNGLSKPLQLTLSMLITSRTGEDKSYLATQRCLLDFLEEQSAVLQFRMRLLNNNVEADKMDMFRRKFEKIAANIAEFEGEEKSQKWQAERIRKDPRAQYLKKIAVYMDGKAFLSNTAEQKSEEKKFIEQRLDLVHGVLELMKPKYEASKLINEMMSKLSIGQVNKLIDLFLQLRGNDILSDSEYVSVTDQMFKNSLSKGVDQNIDLDVNEAAVDSINYKLQHKQLFQLTKVLDEEQLAREQLQRDLNQIRTRP